MIELQAISEEKLDIYLERTWREYREDIIKAGISSVQADINVEQAKSSSLENGKLKPNQYVFDVISDGNSIGFLWLVHRSEISEGNWFISEIELLEEFRGKGLGRATMIAAEEFIKDHGGQSIGLNVFGFNAAARKLYDSLDYQVLATQMKKTL